MAKFGLRSKLPDRRLVQRVALRMARRYHVSLTDMYDMNRRAAVRLANRKAWRVILRASGCTIGGLAHVWGCHRQSVYSSLRQTSPLSLQQNAVARAQALATLRWQYGEALGEAKFAGHDRATQSDVARWNALGRKAAA